MNIPSPEIVASQGDVDMTPFEVVFRKFDDNENGIERYNDLMDTIYTDERVELEFKPFYSFEKEDEHEWNIEEFVNCLSTDLNLNDDQFGFIMDSYHHMLYYNYIKKYHTFIVNDSRIFVDKHLFLHDTDPSRPYFEYPKDIDHGTVHHGQRKLFCVELLYLLQHSSRDKKNTVVYVGAGPGHHIPYLSSLLPNCYFELYDDHFSIEETDKIKLNVRYFTDNDAQKYSKVKNVLFMCDIRDVKIGSKKTVETREKYVSQDMELQQIWVKIMNPDSSLLKFSLPWDDKETKYLKGDIMLQPWAPIHSTETRLVVHKKNNNSIVSYGNRKYEQQMFYYNTITRLLSFSVNEDIPGIHLQHDRAWEFQMFYEYLKRSNPVEFMGWSREKKINTIQGYVNTLESKIMSSALRRYSKEIYSKAPEYIIEKEIYRSILYKELVEEFIPVLEDAGIRTRIKPIKNTVQELLVRYIFNCVVDKSNREVPYEDPVFMSPGPLALKQLHIDLTKAEVPYESMEQVETFIVSAFKENADKILNKEYNPDTKVYIDWKNYHISYESSTFGVNESLRCPYDALNNYWKSSNYLFASLLRYTYINVGNFSLSWKFNEPRDLAIECFASPFNHYFNLYCGAFPDLEVHLGSLGSFFELKHYPKLKLYVNPPYDETVALEAIKKVNTILDNEDDKHIVYFTIPNWTDFDALNVARESMWMFKERLYKKEEFPFYNYFQDKMIYPCENYVITLRNFTIGLIPVVYERGNRETDFEWMIKQEKYGNGLFIFNDNEEDFLSNARHKGGGNAIIRPFKFTTPQRSIGIPTGKNGVGYKELTPQNEVVIKKSLAVVLKLLKTDNYTDVYYSATRRGGLGTGIFTVGEDVKKFIVTSLKAIVDKVNSG